ncbi:DUF3857 domain-containing protein [Flagellimonas sp.]|uniref:DUF3857 domain-containing protein n=1 Tax=Flagellimonas sp. TaxID=2058762 RepID=UPI003BAA661D
MKKIGILLLLLQHMVLQGQQLEFGELTIFESAFKTYEKDTTAHAVYLFEKGDNFFEVRRGYVWLIKKYHAKIKILDKKGFSEADIRIPYYHSDTSTEEVNDIRAITHTDGLKHIVMDNNIFDAEVNEHWSEKRFTFSNVQEGSILEFTYEVQSPFFYNLNGWDFQDDIPKVYTEYNAKIPGNYSYNRSLFGNLPLTVNEATIKENCFSIPNVNKQADCEVLKYVMEDVPAFKSDEEYMLAASNYQSRLEFELSEYLSFRGVKERYTKSWKDVDKEFRSDRDIGGQLRKKNYFERNVPIDIITGTEEEQEKALNLYNFVKSHYSWNGKFGIFRDNNVKKAFDEGVGNVAEINITLINLLNAAGMDADLMLLSTRAHGLPKRSHPVMSDFNYVIAKLDIDGTTYLLDATEKQLPFGMLPYRCLNYYGRVMDLDGESYWYDIESPKGNSKEVMLQLDLNLEEGTARGTFDEMSRGYEAYFKRNHLSNITNQQYLDEVEKNTNGDFYIDQYELDAEKSNDNLLMEHFSFELENLDTSTSIYFNPFLIRFFQSNPFKSSERNYPVDFGYLRNYKYMANITIPKGYRVKSLPENNNLALPGGSGVLRFNCSTSENNVIIFFNLQLRSTQYKSEGYLFIKELFEQAVTSINQSYLVFEKV